MTDATPAPPSQAKMWTDAKYISAGDTVIIWLTRDDIKSLIVTPGKDLNIRFGCYSHSDLIGKPYGCKVISRNGKGYIHVLRPTPELWTLALPHRTQILYMADIAYITLWLNIRPGSRVIEAGTGSGSFTHSIVRTIGSTGRMLSYEFHRQRYEKALEEFTQHGMMDVVTLEHRNVVKDGFTVENWADAVFLDLPAPWDAVVHAREAMRKDRNSRICCYSPCIEQVLQTVTALNDAGFTEICMYEVMFRPWDVFELPPMPTVQDAIDKIRKSDKKREEKRQRQIAASAEKRRLAAERKNDKRKIDDTKDDEDDAADGGAGNETLGMAGPEQSEAKRVKLDNGDADEMTVEMKDSIVNIEASSAAMEEDTKGLLANAVVYEEPEQTFDNVANDLDSDTDDPMDMVDETPASTSSHKKGKSGQNQKGQQGKGKGKNQDKNKGKGKAQQMKIIDVGDREEEYEADPEDDRPMRIVSKPAKEVRGHTAYLTFAVFMPWPPREEEIQAMAAYEAAREAKLAAKAAEAQSGVAGKASTSGTETKKNAKSEPEASSSGALAAEAITSTTAPASMAAAESSTASVSHDQAGEASMAEGTASSSASGVV